MRLPVGASDHARVPPPAPVPTTITSKCWLVDIAPSGMGHLPEPAGAAHGRDRARLLIDLRAGVRDYQLRRDVTAPCRVEGEVRELPDGIHRRVSPRNQDCGGAS